MFRRASMLGLAGTTLIFTCAAHAAPPESNSQLWSELDVTAALASNVSTTFLGAVRVGDALPNPTLAGGGATLDAKLGAWTFTGGELWVVARSAASGNRLDVRLPLGAISYARMIGAVTVSDRNRLEELIGVPGDPRRYRNRFELDWPLLSQDSGKTLFISDEGFYDITRGQWSRNRALGGIALDMSSRAVVQLYYLRQDDRFSLPGHLNVLGMALKINV